VGEDQAASGRFDEGILHVCLLMSDVMFGNAGGRGLRFVTRGRCVSWRS
jgi:hypothetical protein